MVCAGRKSKPRHGQSEGAQKDRAGRHPRPGWATTGLTRPDPEAAGYGPLSRIRSRRPGP